MLRVAVVYENAERIVEALRPRAMEHGIQVVSVDDDAQLARYHLVLSVDDWGDPRVDHWLGEAMDADIDAAWTGRILPFAQNLEKRKRAPRKRVAEMVPYTMDWRYAASRLRERLHHVLGDRVIHLDHVGSTSVPGLAAKDLVDLQVVVADLAAAEEACERCLEAGFVPVGQIFDIDRDMNKQPEYCAVDADPGQPVNVHIRPLESQVWRDTLLFRDWLRGNAFAREEYESVKRTLAEQPGSTVDTYSDAKMPWINDGIRRAERWAAGG